MSDAVIITCNTGEDNPDGMCRSCRVRPEAPASGHWCRPCVIRNAIEGAQKAAACIPALEAELASLLETEAKGTPS